MVSLKTETDCWNELILNNLSNLIGLSLFQNFHLTHVASTWWDAEYWTSKKVALHTKRDVAITDTSTAKLKVWYGISRYIRSRLIPEQTQVERNSGKANVTEYLINKATNRLNVKMELYKNRTTVTKQTTSSRSVDARS